MGGTRNDIRAHTRFRNRRDAGRQLSRHVAPLTKGENTVVVAARRGAIPIGYEVARVLRCPLAALDCPSPPIPDLNGCTVVLVDDGLAYGDVMDTAIRTIRQLGTARIIVAVPVSSPDLAATMRAVADDCMCVVSHFPVHAVEEWYFDYTMPPGDHLDTLIAANRAWRRITRGVSRGRMPVETTEGRQPPPMKVPSL